MQTMCKEDVLDDLDRAACVQARVGTGTRMVCRMRLWAERSMVHTRSAALDPTGLSARATDVDSTRSQLSMVHAS